MDWLKAVVVTLAVIILMLPTTSPAEVHKVLYVASYHTDKGEWTAGIKAGIDSVLGSREEIVLKTHNMDTRLTKSAEKKKAAALVAKGVIDAWDPDVVIISDDNAAKFLLEPYFKNSNIPFVFCGLNWDATVYGLPYLNTTGMVEVQLIREIVDQLSVYAKGKRIGVLRGDTLTNRKEQAHFEAHTGLPMTVRYVGNLTQWKTEYRKLQGEVDMLVLGSLRALDTENVSIRDISRFVHDVTTIASGAYDEFMQAVALVTLSTIPEEQGKWAAEQALNILGGVSPLDIPIVQNRKAKRILNMRLAKKLRITFPLDLLETSHLLSGARQKVLFVNSYHKGYKWSDDVETGLMKALDLTSDEVSGEQRNKNNLDFKVIRMNTKLQPGEEQIRKVAFEIKELIDSWRPDVVVASDDNAVKFVIAPYFTGSSMPVVFCGVNYDAGVYNLPSDNSTGMIEVDLLAETISILKEYAAGERVGYIGADDLSNRKSLRFHKDLLGIDYSDGALVSTFDQWKKEYLRLQQSVDLLILINSVGIKGWIPGDVDRFLLENTTIPTGAGGDSEVRYALLANAKIAEEQGWWAGKAVLKILHGTAPADIPVTRNHKSRLYINMTIANRLGIKLPIDLLERATLIEAH